MNIKSKPTTPDGFTASLCGKCGGNGLYIMAVVNGQPWSATGTTCFSCKGRGWIIKRKPSKVKMMTCYRCKGRFPVDQINTHFQNCNGATSE